ncbi:hypothetical protein F5Y19DRAFT_87815 [Xylariaceae sp. FL1651]|nr:hypothetical protein F5Y19DRAFT_87815 [Xylariaceae sp. FL1651]
MDRNPPKTEGVLTAKPNGRKNTVQPFGNRRPSRKSLGNSESKENSITSDADVGTGASPRPAHPGIRRHRQSDSSIARPFMSPGPSPRLDRSTTSFGTPRHSRDTRIPRPRTTTPTTTAQHQHIPKEQDQAPALPSPMRQPMNLNAAFKLAQEQTAAEANSDSDNTIDLRQAFNMANAEFNGARGIDGSPSPAPRSFRRETQSTIPRMNSSGRNDKDLNKHLQQFDRNHQLAGGSGALSRLFTKSRVGPKVSETGRELAKKASDSSLGGSPERHRLDVWTGNLRNKENTKIAEISDERRPVADIGSGAISAEIPVPSIEYESASDGRPSPSSKMMNLSPEKSMGWHLDADFTAGDLQVSESPRVGVRKTKASAGHTPNSDIPVLPRGNNRLDQIHEREVEAARTVFTEDALTSRQANSRLDEIRAREIEALSKRAVASSRLDEIRIRNSEPRSESPETRRDSVGGLLAERPVSLNSEPQDAAEHASNPESKGEPILDTPVIIYRNSSSGKASGNDQEASKRNEDKRETLSRSDSDDLLRRLARATSSSPGEKVEEADKIDDTPASEKVVVKQPSEESNLNRSPLSREEKRSRNLEVKNSRDRPTVGFAGLRRILSGDSIQEKRTSMPNSDVDPTDRIEAELKLFAPLDNYSEKGSIRAPSPVPSEPIDEETPRPIKVDPKTQPTPRVTGAYVDTPDTVRVKEEEDLPMARNRSASISPTKRSLKPDVGDRARSLRRSGLRSSSLPTASRRARSSSRRRRPLINTARPPTVREDIRAILRANEIDDSTLENFDSILANREIDDRELEQMVNDTVLKVEDDLDVNFPKLTDRERELEAYDRMSKSLKTGLLGIRSAKKGIERLEDKVTQHEHTDQQLHSKDVARAQPVLHLSPLNEANPVLISVPRLYRRDPKFKLTTFGILTVFAMIWYALESTFCFLYAGPQYECTPNVPCDWSPNEPYFPYTMPFMLDEWATGGKGREFALWIGEEVGDIVADVSDWVTNTDFTQFDQRYMNVWQRKRHRRRLRKHGLIPKWTEPAGYKARFPEWNAAKVAKESAQEFGLDEEDETMSADEIIR